MCPVYFDASGALRELLLSLRNQAGQQRHLHPGHSGHQAPSPRGNTKQTITQGTNEGIRPPSLHCGSMTLLWHPSFQIPTCCQGIGTHMPGLDHPASVYTVHIFDYAPLPLNPANNKQQQISNNTSRFCFANISVSFGLYSTPAIFCIDTCLSQIQFERPTQWWQPGAQAPSLEVPSQKRPFFAQNSPDIGSKRPNEGKQPAWFTYVTER